MESYSDPQLLKLRPQFYAIRVYGNGRLPESGLSLRSLMLRVKNVEKIGWNQFVGEVGNVHIAFEISDRNKVILAEVLEP